MRKIILLLCLFLGFAPLSVYSDNRAPTTLNQNFTDNKPPQALNKKLLSLPVNKWVKIHDTGKTDWHRQQHSGIAYDSKRGTVLLFGSDTHGNDWDNSVHEFNPFTEQWTTHYPPSDKSTYRLNSEGMPVAGADKLLPWAMHTYDNIVYDPTRDSLIITAVPEHNPIKKKFNGKIINPTWEYNLESHTWHIVRMKNKKQNKSFFAGASAYDPVNNSVIVYKWGIWELANNHDSWIKIAKGVKHQIHYNMEYDSVNRKFAVFGDHRDTSTIWLYSPDKDPAKTGIWEKRDPSGDPCPPDQHFPVAFDQNTGVFLLLPDNKETVTNTSQKHVSGKAISSSTFIYNVVTNRYTRLDTDMPPQKMNYMMVYDIYHKIFLLITGKANQPVSVWALRLNYEPYKNQ